MLDIELAGRWGLPTITVGDQPILTIGNIAAYELLSNYQTLNVANGGFVIGRYKHVALRGSRAYVFDLERKEMRASLGLVNVHKR